MFKMLLARAKDARAAELQGESGLEGGFTLIELMVVLLIIAILLAIAIPTFLGVSGSARDRAAQSNLTNTMTDVIAYYQNAQTFDATATSTTSSQGTGAGTTSAALQLQEPSFTWGSAACTTSNAAKCVSVAPVDVASSNDGQGVILATMSGTGTCWYAMNLQTTPAAYVASPLPADYTAATGAFAGQTATPNVTTAGTFYATESGSSVTCSAAQAQGFTHWYSSYSAAVSE